MPNVLVVFAPASGPVVTPPELLDMHSHLRRSMTGQSLVSEFCEDLKIWIEHTVYRFRQIDPDILVFIIPINFHKQFTQEENEPLTRISSEPELSRALLAKPSRVTIFFFGHGSYMNMVSQLGEDTMNLMNRIECCKLIMMPLKSADTQRSRTHVDIYLGHCFSSGGDVENNLLYQMYHRLAIMRLSFSIYGCPFPSPVLPSSELTDAIWDTCWLVRFNNVCTPPNNWPDKCVIYPPMPDDFLNNAFVNNTLLLPTLLENERCDWLGGERTYVPTCEKYLKSFTIKISHMYRGFIKNPGDPIIYDLNVDAQYPNIFATSFSILLRDNNNTYEDEMQTKDDALFRLYLRIQNRLLSMFESNMMLVTRSEPNFTTNQHLAWLVTLWSLCQFHLQKIIFDDTQYFQSQDKIERAKKLLRRANKTIQDHVLLKSSDPRAQWLFESHTPVHYEGCFDPMYVGFSIQEIFCKEWSKVDLYYSDSQDPLLRGDRNLYTTGRGRINMVTHKYPDRFSTEFAKDLQMAKESQALAEISGIPQKPPSESQPNKKIYRASQTPHLKRPEFQRPVWKCTRVGCERYNSNDTDICAFCRTERII